MHCLSRDLSDSKPPIPRLFRSKKQLTAYKNKKGLSGTNSQPPVSRSPNYDAQVYFGFEYVWSEYDNDHISVEDKKIHIVPYALSIVQTKR